MFSTALKKRMGFAHSLKKPENIILVSGTDTTGEPAWYYIEVEPHLREQFRRQMDTDLMNLTEFGTVIECGYGESPPPQMRAYMSEQFGFEA